MEKEARLEAQKELTGIVQLARERWAKKDRLSAIACLLKVGSKGLDYFVEIVGDLPTTFGTYLSFTEKYLDAFILETSRKEHLKPAGGKLRMKLDKEKKGIRLLAELYFYNEEKQWSKVTRKGYVKCTAFKDWDSDPDLLDLSRGEVLEYPIDPPKKS